MNTSSLRTVPSTLSMVVVRVSTTTTNAGPGEGAMYSGDVVVHQLKSLQFTGLRRTPLNVMFRTPVTRTQSPRCSGHSWYPYPWTTNVVAPVVGSKSWKSHPSAPRAVHRYVAPLTAASAESHSLCAPGEPSHGSVG